MTHEAATNAAKARAYDGYTAYVMRKPRPVAGYWDEGFTYADVVSPASRQHHEEQGWEVVETYEPNRSNAVPRTPREGVYNHGLEGPHALGYACRYCGGDENDQIHNGSLA